MKFTIERAVLVKMVEQVCGKSRSKKTAGTRIKLSACAARVFVSGGIIAGYEALVFEDGECFVAGKTFALVLKSYAPQPNITIEVNETGLQIAKFSIAVSDYSPKTVPPGEFRVFPVTDVGVAGRRVQYP